jgi:hypothetical protein
MCTTAIENEHEETKYLCAPMLQKVSLSKLAKNNKKIHDKTKSFVSNIRHSSGFFVRNIRHVR